MQNSAWFGLKLHPDLKTTAMAKRKITVEGTEISLVTHRDDDYICITDMARKFNPVPNDVIKSWMRNSSNIDFLGMWEVFHNPDFKTVGYNRFKNESTNNAFILTVKQWVEETGAIGIHAEAGRYGGTYAHKDIAIQFATWLSPTFYLYVIHEFQRLKTEETQRLATDWSLKRTLAKVNYVIHTDAVKERLIPPRVAGTKLEGLYYAGEADLLNLALFGVTAKEWRLQNPEAKGNIRDNASAEQLLVMANLENLNAEFIRQGLSKEQRLERLNEIAIHKMELLVGLPGLKEMEDVKKLK